MLRRTLLLAGLLAAAVLAGCEPGTRWASPTSGQVAGASTSATPPVGAPTWTPCLQEATSLLQRLPSGMTYECTTITVPQDWAAPANGRTFDLALTRVRSVRQRNRIGSLVVNPGGPGASGVDLAVYLSAQLPAEILQRFDLIGFDPRGVGRSAPVRCLSDSELDSVFAVDPDPVSQADFDTEIALDRKLVGECQAKYGDTLRLFSTEQTARDMDAVRAAIGDPKITYLGYSYGTLLGATYAQLFPTHIRALVLDGAVDPTENAVDSSQGQAKGFEHAFDEFAAWCKQDTGCPIRPDARARVNQALSAARQAPVKGPDGRAATAGWIMTGVTEAMYSQQEWSLLASAIADLGHGDARKIFALADSYASRDDTGHYSNMYDIFTTVECNDDGSGETVAQARALQSVWRTEYPLFGAQMAVGLAYCAVWPAKRDPYPTGKAVGAPPIVVVGTTNDPATPYEQTARLAAMLGVGHVVTWQGEGHTAYPQTACIRQAVDNYLLSLTVPRDGLTCPAR